MAEGDRRLRWTHSAGGPLVLLPTRHRRSWGGCWRPRGATDYDRACQVNDYQGVLTAGAGDALVLSTPDLTAPCRLGGVRYLLRWGFAPSEAEMLTAFRAAAASLTADERDVFQHPGGRVVLFDAALTWRLSSGGVSFPLAAGRYEVAACVWEEGDVGFTAHAFHRLA